MKRKSINNLGIHLLLINAFVYIAASQYAPFLSSYYTKAGISPVEIGILLTIGPIISILIQPIWAVISDRTGKRKVVLSTVVLGSAITIFTYYIGNSFLTFFIASVLISVFVTAIIPLNDAITLHSAHKNHLEFSKIRMGGTVGYAIMVIFAGQIVKRIPSLSFLLGAVAYTLLFLLIIKLPKDNPSDFPPLKPQSRKQGQKKEKLSPFHIFESKEIYFILAFSFISQVGLSFYFSFLGVYMLKMGLNESTIGIANSIAAFSELPVLFLINRMIKKFSPMKISMLACVILSLRILFITGGSLPFVILSSILHGISYMTVYFSCAVFISQNVKLENQSKGQSILTIVQAGLGSITGNIVGGFLLDYYGLKTAYILMAALVFLVAGLIALLRFIYRRRLNQSCSSIK